MQSIICAASISEFGPCRLMTKFAARLNVQVTNHKPTPRGTVGSIGRPTRFSGRSDQLARECFCERNGLVFDLELQVNCYLRSVHRMPENIGLEPPTVEPFAHFQHRAR